ncbi:MAG: hypothetical protein JWN51_1618 [Phycisphaerales bacterium]|nr:hypothetical protein [Phycisphaerales bacterium]
MGVLVLANPREEAHEMYKIRSANRVQMLNCRATRQQSPQ